MNGSILRLYSPIFRDSSLNPVVFLVLFCFLDGYRTSIERNVELKKKKKCYGKNERGLKNLLTIRKKSTRDILIRSCKKVVNGPARRARKLKLIKN